jgi:long-chain fatty acid transport protein
MCPINYTFAPSKPKNIKCMRKLKLFAILWQIVSLPTFAGGLLTNTNQHVAFLRMMARDASTEIDAVYSNPAGLAFMKDGFHFSFNGQSAYQTRTITSTFAPFARNANTLEQSTKVFKGEASAPIIPSVFAAYKRGNWTFSGEFAVTGGGGKATFNDGLGSFESIVAMVPAMVNTLAAQNSALSSYAINRYTVDSYMKGKQYIFGLQLGATYKFLDCLSGFIGARMNYVSNAYYGYLKNIEIGLAAGGNMMNASETFAALAQSPYLDESTKAMAGLLSSATADKELDCKQTGWGVTPILGLDFKKGRWNIGAKYEFKTNLNIENKTSVNTTGFKDYDHGVNTPADIPALLTLGVSYEILPTLRASVGYHHFFDPSASMANGKEQYTGHGTNEYLWGAEWDVCKWAQISAGMQRTKYGVEDGYQSDMSFSVSSYSYGFGAGFKLSERCKLNIAYFWTDYGTYDKQMSVYNNMDTKLSAMGVSDAIFNAVSKYNDLSGSDSFTRTNKVFGIGIDYRF